MGRIFWDKPIATNPTTSKHRSGGCDLRMKSLSISTSFRPRDLRFPHATATRRSWGISHAKTGILRSKNTWCGPWQQIMAGWWFGTFFIFPYIGNNHPNWLIFFRGVQTTNQMDMFAHNLFTALSSLSSGAVRFQNAQTKTRQNLGISGASRLGSTKNSPLTIVFGNGHHPVPPPTKHQKACSPKTEIT